jgi:hypothetical protein
MRAMLPFATVGDRYESPRWIDGFSHLRCRELDLGGGAVMLGFALGPLPLLLLAQTQVVRLAQRFGPRTLRRVQQVAMLLAAGMLVWRGAVAMQGQSCCH